MPHPCHLPRPETRIALANLATITAGGTYVLWLHLPLARRVVVGALGAIDFMSGFYGYVGSARGPGGLGARVMRHINGSPRLRWHIDYLRRVAVPVDAWICLSPRNREHDWAAALAAIAGARLPVPGFGASDCRCPAHLVAFVEIPGSGVFLETLFTTRHCLASGFFEPKQIIMTPTSFAGDSNSPDRCHRRGG